MGKLVNLFTNDCVVFFYLQVLINKNTVTRHINGSFSFLCFFQQMNIVNYLIFIIALATGCPFCRMVKIKAASFWSVFGEGK